MGDLPALAQNHRQAMKLFDDCVDRHERLARAVIEREAIEAANAARDAAQAKAAVPKKKRWWRFGRDGG
jgi:hypothetical protein